MDGVLTSSVTIPAKREHVRPILATSLCGIGGVGLLIGLFLAWYTLTNNTQAAFFFLNGSPIFLTLPSVCLGLLCAGNVIVSGIMIYSRPEEHVRWAWLSIIFGLIGFGPWNWFGTFGIGSSLAITGGVIGLAFRPSEH